MPTDSVERGRLPGASEPGSPSSSQNICPREPSGQPSCGITGEDCSQPPDGVAVNILPALSITSMCTVSPITLPRRGRGFSPALLPLCRLANRGPPAPAGTPPAPSTVTPPGGAPTLAPPRV